MKVSSIFLSILLLLGAIASAAARPDIVVFLADDMSQLDSAAYGEKVIRTPHMQRLAEQGITFDRAYVASPSCAPSRAALLSGLMPARNGAESNHAKPRAEIRKWPAYFQELGYEVVSFGKVSHYRHTRDYGFDHFADDGFHQHESIGHAVEWLRTRTSTKPLCLMVGTNWPHVPWPESDLGYDPAALTLPAGTIDTPATRDWRAKYAAAVTKADDDLGTIRAAAERHLGADTLFLFTADHGAQWPFGKWNLYESGVCVPLLVAWPGVARPGTRSAAMVQWIDLLPTLLEAAGGKAPADIDGRSFLPVLRGESQVHRERIFTTHSNDNRMNVYPARAVCDARWKYIRNLRPDAAFTTHIDLVAGRLGQRAFFSTWEAAAKTDPHAAAILKRYHARPAEELYDLAADPHEQRNLAADSQHAPQLATLRAGLDSWMKQQGDTQRIPVEPRLLSDPASYGPSAEIGDAPVAAALWDERRKLATAKELPGLEGVEFHVIKKWDQPADGYHFLHGVGLGWHKGRLYASIGHNKGAENTVTEEAQYRVSEDAGRTWSELRVIDDGAEDNLAVSHGVFLSHAGKLWAFHGAYYKKMERIHTRAYSLNESTGQWVKHGVILDGGFWVMNQPVRMSNDRWIMPGFRGEMHTGKDTHPAAVAISRGEDFTKWDLVAIPAPQGIRMWGESAIIVEGAKVLNIARYGGKPLALIARSADHGRTWAASAESNLPMTTSKPTAGILSNGQRYLVCTTAADNGGRRAPLTIAVSQPGSELLSKVYVIRHAEHAGVGESHPRASLSYPCATEHEGRLYVGFSNNGGRRGNLNSAELAVIPIALLSR